MAFAQVPLTAIRSTDLPPVLSAASSMQPQDAADFLLKRAALLKKDKRGRVRQVGESLEMAARIIAAKNPAERRAAVAALPVKVHRIPLENGDVMKQFVVRGVVTKEILEPAIPRHVERETSSGPSEVAHTDCFEDAEEPCLTETEEAEWDSEIALADYDTAVMVTDTSAIDSLMSDYCSNYPWAPECGEPGGPSAERPAGCVQQLGQAYEDVGDAVVDVIARYGAQAAAKAMGKKAGKLLVLGARVNMWVAVGVGAFSLGFLGACLIGKYNTHLEGAPSGADNIPVVALREDEFWRVLRA
jgi:hypothetical protein